MPLWIKNKAAMFIKKMRRFTPLDVYLKGCFIEKDLLIEVVECKLNL